MRQRIPSCCLLASVLWVCMAGLVFGQDKAPSTGPRPVTARDHIRGDPAAPVKVIEFADTECPLCKSFHPTMARLLQDYPGKIAWVFRHYPIDEIHPKARKEAEATECAAELGGPAAFWKYLDRLYEITPSSDGLDPAQLPRIALHIGLNQKTFAQCLNSGRHAGRVQEDVADALAAKAQGTPYTVVLAPNGRQFAILGAQPYSTLKIVVDLALQSK